MKRPHDLREGDVFGRYVIESTLGSGAMGRVLCARDTVLDRRVALKIILAERATRERAVGRFFREAKLAAQLTHPNAVHIYDVGEIDGISFIAMEYVRGRTLATYVNDGATPPEKILRWMLDIARALAVAHARGLLHRDVKPENVLISSDDFPKLADFGLAKKRETTPELRATFHTRTGYVVGTPAFMAPEQLAGRDLDARADQFAWALTTYTAVSGRNPRKADPLLRAPLPLLCEIAPSIPRRAAEVVARAMSRDPEQRFRDMDELVRELDASISTRTSPTGPPPAARSAPPPSMQWVERVEDGNALSCAAQLRLLAKPRAPEGPSSSRAAPSLGDDTPSDQEILAESWWFTTTVAACPAAPLTCASFSPDGTSVVAVGAGGVAVFEGGAWRAVDIRMDPSVVLCVKALDDGTFVLGGREGLALHVSERGPIGGWTPYFGTNELPVAERARVTFHAVDARRGSIDEIILAGGYASRGVAAFATDERIELTTAQMGSIYHLVSGALVVGCGDGGVSFVTRSGIGAAIDDGSVAMSMALLDEQTIAIGGVQGKVSVLAPLSLSHGIEQVETSAAVVALAPADAVEAWAVDANCDLFRRARRGRWIAWPRAPGVKAQPVAAWATYGRLVVVAADGVVLEGRRA